LRRGGGAGRDEQAEQDVRTQDGGMQVHGYSSLVVVRDAGYPPPRSRCGTSQDRRAIVGSESRYRRGSGPVAVIRDRIAAIVRFPTAASGSVGAGHRFAIRTAIPAATMKL
jgi:hypothetical protein